MRNLLCAVYLRWSLPFWDFRYETRQFLCVCMCVCVCVCACVRVHGCLLCHSASLAACAIVTNGISTDASVGASDRLRCVQIRKDLVRSFPTNVFFCSLDAEGTHRLHRTLLASAWYRPNVGYGVMLRACARVRADACVCVSVCLSVSLCTVCEMKRRLNANSRLLLRAPR